VRSRRGRAFAGLVLACLVVGGGSIAWSARRAASADVAHPAAGLRLPAGPRVVFRDLDRADAANYGHLTVAALAGGVRTRVVTGLACERVYFAGGRGLCLAKGGGFATLYHAEILGPKLDRLHELPLSGIPSRARVSPDGRYGAATTFVSGHSYSTPGKFSTQATIIELATGKVVSDLERFRVYRGSELIDKPDFNFWGITFARDSNRFYATLATGGKTYLVRGDVRARTVRVLHENVECPSLSPDGTRIAYKKVVRIVPGSPRIWQLHVLDLRTMKETRLAETRAIDDQAEWLDEGHVLYQADEQVWVVRADGTGSPRRFLAGAASPAVVRG
jgi:hypothetical protein